MKRTDAEREPAFERLIARGLEGETDASGNACPDADLLAAWFDRSLSVGEAERVEAHASACASCQHILADLARTEPAVIRAAPEPSPARPWHWHWRWLAPLATAAVVVALLGPRMMVAPDPPVEQADRQLAAKAETAPAPQPRPPQSFQAPPAAEQGAPAPSRAAAPPRASVPSTSARSGGGGEAEGRVVARAEPKGTIADAIVQPLPPPPVEAQARESAAKPGAADRVGPVAESVVGAPPPPAPRTLAPSQARLQSLAVKAATPSVPPIPTIAASPSGRVAWRVGAGGRIEQATGNRVTWQLQASGVTADLAAASAPDDTTCWAVGTGGVVVLTTDGVTWRRAASPSMADLVLVHATSSTAAAVRAFDGTEYSTSDGGRTWTRR